MLRMMYKGLWVTPVHLSSLVSCLCSLYIDLSIKNMNGAPAMCQAPELQQRERHGVCPAEAPSLGERISGRGTKDFGRARG